MTSPAQKKDEDDEEDALDKKPFFSFLPDTNFEPMDKLLDPIFFPFVEDTLCTLPICCGIPNCSAPVNRQGMYCDLHEAEVNLPFALGMTTAEPPLYPELLLKSDYATQPPRHRMASLPPYHHIQKMEQVKHELCFVRNCRNIARQDHICVTHLNKQERGEAIFSDNEAEMIKRQGNRHLDLIKDQKPKNGARLCAIESCPTLAKTGGYCVRHGGGKRCVKPNCNRLVSRGGLCIRHGVKKVCTEENCQRQVVSFGKCVAHSGGKRCNHPDGCRTLAKAGGLCVRHGGGARCIAPQCTKLVLRAGMCKEHLGSQAPPRRRKKK